MESEWRADAATPFFNYQENLFFSSTPLSSNQTSAANSGLELASVSTTKVANATSQSASVTSPDASDFGVGPKHLSKRQELALDNSAEVFGKNKIKPP